MRGGPIGPRVGEDCTGVLGYCNPCNPSRFQLRSGTAFYQAGIVTFHHFLHHSFSQGRSKHGLCDFPSPGQVGTHDARPSCTQDWEQLPRTVVRPRQLSADYNELWLPEVSHVKPTSHLHLRRSYCRILIWAPTPELIRQTFHPHKINISVPQYFRRRRWK